MNRSLSTALSLLSLIAVSCKTRSYNSESESTAEGVRQTESGFLLEVFSEKNKDGQRARIKVGGELIAAGEWVKDGSSGNSYKIVPSGVYEGHVCSNFRVSYYDPANEGSLRNNKVFVHWIVPEGTIRQQCSARLAQAQGDYTIGQKTPLKAIKPVDPTRTAHGILSMSKKSGEWVATLSLNGRVLRSGALKAQGTAGGSYTIALEEGDVCGTFRISRWDPANEGSFRKDQTVGVEWLKPDGSVAKTCAGEYAGANGSYSGFKHGFLGTYFLGKRDTSNYLWSISDDRNVATLKLNGTTIFEGTLTTQDQSIVIKTPEGFVCGSYSVQPITTGVWNFSWAPPGGSVARQCADTLGDSSGAYRGNSVLRGVFAPQK